MKKKAVWLMVSCSMVLTLVLAPCALAASATKPEKPQYGGVLRLGVASDCTYFDDGLGSQLGEYTLMQTNEFIMDSDWARGPAGTGQFDFFIGERPRVGEFQFRMAESWELLPDQDTIVLHIRKGVHFHNKPPANGREMTADDVVASLMNAWQSPKSYLTRYHPWDKWMESVTAPDKYTVVFKAKPEVPAMAL